ncbi:Tubulin-folding cofactor E [Abeliophyllum distichum]|uniref:Tubulin-folding cofactor E n=1 Tax=Abeliophyllum distichum TaxID=126358 RepID=A0ABD1RPZ2_9LAMI
MPYAAVSLKCVGASIGEKPPVIEKLPATTTVRKLKNLYQSFFKLKSVKPVLFLQEKARVLHDFLKSKGLRSSSITNFYTAIFMDLQGSPLPTLLEDDMASLIELESVMSRPFL